jgi:hypothetical protein
MVGEFVSEYKMAIVGEGASSADWSIALEREAVIRPLAEHLGLSHAIIAAFVELSGLFFKIHRGHGKIPPAQKQKSPPSDGLF